MKRRKKFISLAFAMMMALSLMLPAGAVNDSVEALYAQYQEMIDAANSTYGLSLSLLPLDAYDAATMPAAAAFQAMLNEYCASRAEAEAQVAGEVLEIYPEPGASVRPQGTGPVTRTYVATRTYGMGTVSIAFTGSFSIAQLPSGLYYVHSYAFLTPTATSTSSALYYALDGEAAVQQIDAGETYCQSQRFLVYVNNAFYDTTTVSAFFYFDKADGTITAAGA